MYSWQALTVERLDTSSITQSSSSALPLPRSFLFTAQLNRNPFILGALLSSTDSRRRRRKRRPHEPVAVIRLRLRAEEELLARLVGEVAPHLVPVFFRLQERHQVDP